MACSRALLCSHSSTLPWQGAEMQTSGSAGNLESMNCCLPPSCHSWQHRSKRRDDLFKLTHLLRGGQSQNPGLLFLRGSLHFQRGWPYPHFRCPTKRLHLLMQTLVQWVYVCDLALFPLSFLLEMLVPIYLLLLALGVFL